MGSKGNSRHIKSLAAPRYYAVHKKERMYTMKPAPGRHTLQRSIPLLAFARKIGIAATRSSGTKMIKGKDILVNGRPITDERYPIGLNDIVELAPAKQSYRITINTRGQVTIEKADGISRLCKIVQKYKTGKGQVMIRLHDGTVAKAPKDASTNDSVSMGKDGVEKVVKLQKGSKCTVIEGVHVGESGTVKEIKPGTANVPSAVTVEGTAGEFETLLRNIMAVE